MRFTIRFCHLETIPSIRINSIIYQGNSIGVMGNSGQSSATHLHTDLVRGFMAQPYRLKDIDFDTETIKQLNYFIDKGLFKTDILITSYFCDPEYFDFNGEWKIHPAYDVVPLNRYDTDANFTIHWNRSFPGQVISKGNDSAYGNYIHIGFDR